jgi:hypothetical protein
MVLFPSLVQPIEMQRTHNLVILGIGPLASDETGRMLVALGVALALGPAELSPSLSHSLSSQLPSGPGGHPLCRAARSHGITFPRHRKIMFVSLAGVDDTHHHPPHSTPHRIRSLLQPARSLPSSLPSRRSAAPCPPIAPE